MEVACVHVYYSSRSQNTVENYYFPGKVYNKSRNLGQSLT